MVDRRWIPVHGRPLQLWVSTIVTAIPGVAQLSCCPWWSSKCYTQPSAWSATKCIPRVIVPCVTMAWITSVDVLVRFTARARRLCTSCMAWMRSGTLMEAKYSSLRFVALSSLRWMRCLLELKRNVSSSKRCFDAYTTIACTAVLYSCQLAERLQHTGYD